MEFPRERESLSLVNIEIIFDNVAAFALEAVSIRASSGRTREAGGERQRGPEGQLLRHSYAMSFPPGEEFFRRLCPPLNEACAIEGRQGPIANPGVELSSRFCPHLDCEMSGKLYPVRSVRKHFYRKIFIILAKFFE